jgi:hypothetical protein
MLVVGSVLMARPSCAYQARIAPQACSWPSRYVGPAVCESENRARVEQGHSSYDIFQTFEDVI